MTNRIDANAVQTRCLYSAARNLQYRTTNARMPKITTVVTLLSLLALLCRSRADELSPEQLWRFIAKSDLVLVSQVTFPKKSGLTLNALEDKPLKMVLQNIQVLKTNRNSVNVSLGKQSELAISFANIAEEAAVALPKLHGREVVLFLTYEKGGIHRACSVVPPFFPVVTADVPRIKAEVTSQNNIIAFYRTNALVVPHLCAGVKEILDRATQDRYPNYHAILSMRTIAIPCLVRYMDDKRTVANPVLELDGYHPMARNVIQLGNQPLAAITGENLVVPSDLDGTPEADQRSLDAWKIYLAKKFPHFAPPFLRQGQNPADEPQKGE
jgi:hypothetical protein